MSENPLRLMFIGAHPDDETQVGGTLALLSRSKNEGYVYLTTPGKGGKPNEDELRLSEEEILERRRAEAKRFAKELGITTLVADIPSTLLEGSEEDILSLVSALRNIRPDIIVLQNDGDYHFEHRRTRELALIATEIAARSALLERGQKIQNFIILETDGLNVLANPSIYIDISSVFLQKREATLKAYGERLGGLTRLDESLSAMRGERFGVEHAEAFSLVTPPWYRMTEAAARSLTRLIGLRASSP